MISIDKLYLGVIASAAIGFAISYGDIYLFHICFILLLLFGLIHLKNSKFKLFIISRHNNHIIFLLWMSIWYTLSILWSPDYILGLKYLFYIYCGLIISFTIIKYSTSLIRLNTIYKMLSIIFVVELIIAILESFTVFKWPTSPYSSLHTYLGKESLGYSESQYLITYSAFTPPTGFHWNTNNLAITMVMILPFFLCQKKIILKILGSILITLIIFLSASRAVFLGLLLVYFIYLLIIKKDLVSILLIWIFSISLISTLSLLKESDNPRINEVSNSLVALELYLKGDIDIGGSLQWRRELINNGFTSLVESNGLGVGAGGSTALQERNGGVAGRFTSMHNFWIEILVEGGIIFGFMGLVWYLHMVYNLFIISISKKSKELKFFSQSLFLTMIGFVPAAISASSTIYFFPMWIMFGMSMAVISLYNKSKVNSII